MPKKDIKLVFHLITSKTFWCGAPLVISEIVKRGHYVSVFDENNLPSYKNLLDCDVWIDMSSIIKPAFYISVEKEYKRRKSLNLKTPLMIDPPQAILNSFDKRRTHEIFMDLIPESYNLTGKNNFDVLNKFKLDQFVVIKDPTGWWGTGVERLTPQNASKKYANAKNLIVQKYIPLNRGVGRIVTINNGDDFEIACSYLRVPKSWRTGVDVSYKCIKEPVTKQLRQFALIVSKRCGLYLNGIDYLYDKGKYILLEVNAVPAMKEPNDIFGVNIQKKLLDHMERNINK